MLPPKTSANDVVLFTQEAANRDEGTRDESQRQDQQQPSGSTPQEDARRSVSAAPGGQLPPPARLALPPLGRRDLSIASLSSDGLRRSILSITATPVASQFQLPRMNRRDFLIACLDQALDIASQIEEDLDDTGETPQGECCAHRSRPSQGRPRD